MRLFCGLFFVLLRLLTRADYLTFFLLMHDQSSPALFLIPLETCQDREFQLIILLLQRTVVRWRSVTWLQLKFMLTFFLNCLWMASSASFIVTPFRFLAVTSSPRGKCKSIFLTGGSVNIFLRYSLSSILVGDVFSFLPSHVELVMGL